MALFRALFVALVLAPILACGNDPEAPGTDRFEVRTLSESLLEATPARTVVLPGAPELLGVDGRGQPIASIAGSVWAVTGSGSERRRLYAGPGDPVFLGEIRTLRPRAEGGAWLGADAGLFAVDGLYVAAVATLGPILEVSDVSAGPLAGLWLSTPAALLLSLPDELASFEIPDTTGPYVGLAVRPDGSQALAWVGEEALLLAPDGLDLDVRGLPFLARPRAVAATADALWLAADEGLYALPRGGAWVRVDSTSGPIRVDVLEADATEVFALGAGQVVVIDLAAERLSVLALDGATAVAAAGSGGFWTARGATLEGWGLGAPRFEADVLPFIETHCVACHDQGTGDYRIYDNFVSRAEAALERIRTGDMPRCGTDRVRCPESEQLGPDLYGVLERWIEEGKLP